MATLNIRNIDEQAKSGLKLAAGAHGMTIGEYVAALHRLHRVVLESASHGYGVELDPEAVYATGMLVDSGLPVVFT